MAHDLPPIDALRHLLERLKANDIAWFREQFGEGRLAWLQERLSPADADALGGHLDSGDLGWVRSRIAGLDLPGVVTPAAAATAATTAAAIAATPEIIETAAPEPTGTTPDDERRRRGWLLSIPVLVLAAILLGVGLARCDGSTSKSTSPADVVADTEALPAATDADLPDLLGAAGASGNFTTLAAAVDAAGLTGTLQGDGPFTLFAPTDEAFAALPSGLVDALLLPANKDVLTKVLTYHVVSGTVRRADLKTGDLGTLEGGNIGVDVAADSVTLNGATRLVGDEVVTSNGVIHPIDQVLLPEGVDPAALLNPVTASTPAVVETTAEPTTEPTTTEVATTTVAPTTTSAPAGSLDIVATAGAAGGFSKLAQALDAAGLTSVLQGPGPFTVFAPSDEAFAKVPADVLAGLLDPKNKAMLTKVLSYHVLKGSVASTSLATGSYDSVEGSKLAVKVAGGKVTVDNATVLKADVPASNGIIHVVDAVLIPSDVDLSKLGAATAAATVPSTAVPTTVAVPEGLTVYFDSGSAALTSEARAKITGAVETLRKLASGSKVKIVGHADQNGNAAANQKLSIARADAVRSALEAGLGGDASKITFDVSAVGDSQPDVDLAKSRKVTIEIQP